MLSYLEVIKVLEKADIHTKLSIKLQEDHLLFIILKDGMKKTLN